MTKNIKSPVRNVTPFGVNPKVLLFLYCWIIITDLCMYAGWHSVSKFLFHYEAFAHHCVGDPAGGFVNDQRLNNHLFICTEQDLALQKCYIFALIGEYMTSAFAGVSYDIFGPKITTLCGKLLLFISWAIITLNTTIDSLTYIGFYLMGAACEMQYYAALNIILLFPKREGRVASLISACVIMCNFMPVFLEISAKYTNAPLYVISGTYVVFFPLVNTLIILFLCPWKPYIRESDAFGSELNNHDAFGNICAEESCSNETHSICCKSTSSESNETLDDRSLIEGHLQNMDPHAQVHDEARELRSAEGDCKCFGVHDEATPNSMDYHTNEYNSDSASNSTKKGGRKKLISAKKRNTVKGLFYEYKTAKFILLLIYAAVFAFNIAFFNVILTRYFSSSVLNVHAAMLPLTAISITAFGFAYNVMETFRVLYVVSAIGLAAFFCTLFHEYDALGIIACICYQFYYANEYQSYVFVQRYCNLEYFGTLNGTISAFQVPFCIIADFLYNYVAVNDEATFKNVILGIVLVNTCQFVTVHLMKQAVEREKSTSESPVCCCTQRIQSHC